MKSLYFMILSTMLVLFSACSSKKYFEPSTTFSVSSVAKTYGGSIVDLSRNGGTLKDGSYIGYAGKNMIQLGDGYRFVNESKRYVLAANAEGILKILDKNTKEAIRAVALHVPVVSATIKDGVIAYILNNNTFGIYLMEGNRKIIESRSERTLAIDTRAASPMFIENLVVMPMLDGKLIIVDMRNVENAKVVYISSAPVFNNVIYLSRMGNTMVAATATRLITLGSEGKLEYTANISEVALGTHRIYLFTKEGDIIALDEHLKKIASHKFKFAHYAVSTAFDGKVFALDQQGSLIVLNKDLTKFKVYDVGAVDEPAFITGKKLYKDEKVIDLSKLGYE